MERPAPSAIEQRWRELMGDPLLSMPRLRERAFRGDLAGDQLRSLHWRVFLGQLAPPPAPTSPSSLSNPSSWPLALSQLRTEWDRCRDQYLRSPDGQLVVDGESSSGHLGVGGSGGAGMSRSSSNGKRVEKEPVVVDLGVNNPLSDDAGNPWKTWFRDLELRQTVRQDVCRTYPELDYFRRPEVQDQMTNILHVFAKLNEDIGYRQGMHELLGPLLHAIDHDSLPPTSPPPDGLSLAYLTLSRDHVEHDTYSLFSLLMRSAKSDYDFNATVPIPIHSPSVPSRSAFGESPVLTNPSVGGSMVIGTKLVQPIIDKCCRIFDAHLRRTDFELWRHLEELRIEPQIWGIRWLRLLFTREFPLAEALSIWDAVFAHDPTLRLAEFVCLAMLLRGREAILDSDYSSALQLLLRYPAPADGDQKLSLMVRQAVYLQSNLSAEAGLEVRRQNRDLGAQVGESSSRPAMPRKVSPTTMAKRNPNARHSVASSSPVGAYLDDVNDLAKNVYDLPKAFNQAFAEFKRQYASTGTTSPVGSEGSRSGTTHQQRQMAEDLSAIKAANEAMGDALATCIDVLEEGEVAGKPSATASGQDLGDGGKVMALTALRHIQDVLVGRADVFDGRVMAPILQRQRQKKRAGSASAQSSSTPDVVIRPPAVAHTHHGDVRRGSAASISSIPPAASGPRRANPTLSRTVYGSASPTSSQASGGGSPPMPPPNKSPSMWQGPATAGFSGGRAGRGPSRPGLAKVHETGSAPSEAEAGEAKSTPDPLGVLSA